MTEFIVHDNLMAAALKSIKRLDTGVNLVNLRIIKDHLSVEFITPQMRGRLRVPVEVKEPGESFTIDYARAEAIFKDQDQRVRLRDKRLSFSSGSSSYKGADIPISSSPDLKITIPSESTVLDESIITIFKMLMEMMSLDHVIDDEEELPLYVRTMNGHLIMASADGLHAAISRVKLTEAHSSKLDDIRMRIPARYARVFSEFSTGEMKINVGESRIIVSTPHGVVELPTLQLSSVKFKQILKLESTVGAATASFTVRAEDLLKTTRKLLIHKNESPLSLCIEKDSLRISFESKSMGKVSDAVDIKAVKPSRGGDGGSMAMNEAVLLDILKRINGDITVSFHDGRLMTIKKTVTDGVDVSYYLIGVSLQ